VLVEGESSSDVDWRNVVLVDVTPVITCVSLSLFSRRNHNMYYDYRCFGRSMSLYFDYLRCMKAKQKNSIIT
jgi:hypothetical protein